MRSHTLKKGHESISKPFCKFTYVAVELKEDPQIPPLFTSRRKFFARFYPSYFSTSWTTNAFTQIFILSLSFEISNAQVGHRAKITTFRAPNP